jgi:Fe-S-cluster containining protein
MRDLRLPDGDAVRWLALHATPTPGYLEFECRCTKLTADGRCGIYEDRPLVCKVFAPGGADCLDTVRRRRTPEQYLRIRDAGDPERIHA